MSSIDSICEIIMVILGHYCESVAMSNSAFMYASCIHKISSIYCLASFKFIDIIVIDLESPQFLLNYVAFQFRWPKELGKCR